MRVVTYQSPGGAKMSICRRCEARHEAAGEWPKDWRGREYATVSMGEHNGHCSSPRHHVSAPVRDTRPYHTTEG